MKENTIGIEMDPSQCADYVQIMTCGSPDCNHIHVSLWKDGALLPFAAMSVSEKLITDMALALLDVKKSKKGADFS